MDPEVEVQSLRRTWPQRETDVLMELTEDLEGLLGPLDNLADKGAFWQEISQRMLTHGFERNGNACSRKYRHVTEPRPNLSKKDDDLKEVLKTEVELDDNSYPGEGDEKNLENRASKKYKLLRWCQEERDLLADTIKSQRQKEARTGSEPMNITELSELATDVLAEFGYTRTPRAISQYYQRNGTQLVGYNGTTDDEKDDSLIVISEKRDTPNKADATRNSTPLTEKKQRIQRKHTPHQKALLDAAFAMSNYATTEMFEELKQQGFTKEQVNSAFQARRNKITKAFDGTARKGSQSTTIDSEEARMQASIFNSERRYRRRSHKMPGKRKSEGDVNDDEQDRKRVRQDNHGMNLQETAGSPVGGPPYTVSGGGLPSLNTVLSRLSREPTSLSLATPMQANRDTLRHSIVHSSVSEGGSSVNQHHSSLTANTPTTPVGIQPTVNIKLSTAPKEQSPVVDVLLSARNSLQQDLDSEVTANERLAVEIIQRKARLAEETRKLMEMEKFCLAGEEREKKKREALKGFDEWYKTIG